MSIIHSIKNAKPDYRRAYWTNFAQTGNPNGKGLPKWAPYDPEMEKILDITSDGQAVSKTDPRKARLDVIELALQDSAKIQTRGGI